ncbi:MAG: SMI1/KNR4 family protein [Candidatus Sericytochromatia bacterium]
MQARFIDSYPPASDEAIARFESESGLALPEDYRRFLQSSNGGSPEPEYFRSANGRVHEIMFWYGLDYAAPEGPINLLLRWKVGQMLMRSPASLICIGRSSEGNLLLLSLDPADKGQVYLWYHDAHPYAIWDKGPAAETPEQRLERMGIERIADSIATLLDCALSDAERHDHFQQRLG